MSERGMKFVDVGHIPPSFPPVSRYDGEIPPPKTDAERARRNAKPLKE